MELCLTWLFPENSKCYQRPIKMGLKSKKNQSRCWGNIQLTKTHTTQWGNIDITKAFVGTYQYSESFTTRTNWAAKKTFLSNEYLNSRYEYFLSACHTYWKITPWFCIPGKQRFHNCFSFMTLPKDTSLSASDTNMWC